jgi:periplasmic mercuric ion binding protein
MSMKQSLVAITVARLAASGAVWAAPDRTVVLMFGGKFCDAYLGDVEFALKKVPGVRAVDFKSMKGHAVVTVEADKAKPDQLAQVVNGVKGEWWHCTAQAMK